MSEATITTGYKVRLREPRDYPLEGSLQNDQGVLAKYRLEPNEWTEVPKNVFDFLKGRFDGPRYSVAFDTEYNEKNPHRPGEDPKMMREDQNKYILEFRETQYG